MWLSVWSKVQTCIWSRWFHCHSLSPASVTSRLVLPFWYRLTWVVPEKGPLNGCVCVRACVCVCVCLSLCVYTNRSWQSMYERHSTTHTITSVWWQHLPKQLIISQLQAKPNCRATANNWPRTTSSLHAIFKVFEVLKLLSDWVVALWQLTSNCRDFGLRQCCVTRAVYSRLTQNMQRLTTNSITVEYFTKQDNCRHQTSPPIHTLLHLLNA